MKPLRRLVVAAAAVAAGLSVSSTATAQAAPTCNARAAAQLEQRLPVDPYTVGSRRLGQTLCFDFTGDGRRDIVFTGWEAMNQGAHYWAAFRATRSSWVRAKFKRSCCGADPRFGRALSIARRGRRIVVKQSVYRSSDPGCCPTGGTRTGRWGWTSGRLALLGVALDPE